MLVRALFLLVICNKPVCALALSLVLRMKVAKELVRCLAWPETDLIKSCANPRKMLCRTGAALLRHIRELAGGCDKKHRHLGHLKAPTDSAQGELLEQRTLEILGKNFLQSLLDTFHPF